MRKFSILLVFVYITVFSLYNFVIAANPVSPIVPSDNIQDPGDPGTAWGGCGPSDSNCYVTVSSEISGLDPAIETNTIDNGDYLQEWQWNTLAGDSGLKLSTTSVVSLRNQKLLEVNRNGTNNDFDDGDPTTTYAGYFSNTENGAGNVYGVFGTASGGAEGAGVLGTGYVGVIGQTLNASSSGVRGIGSTSGYGVEGYSFNIAGGYGLFANTYGQSTPILLQAQQGLTAGAIKTMLDIMVGSTGGNSNDETNTGGSIDYKIQTSSSGGEGVFISNQLISKWTDATPATRTSEFSITGVNGGTTGTLLTISGNGMTGIGDTTPDYRLDIETDVASYTANFFNDGNATTRSGILIQGGLDDHTAAGPSTLVGFQDGNGTAVGSITFGSSATAYNTTSDQRLKNTVNERTNSSLDLLNQIQIHDFTWKGDAHNNLYTGVYAQELYDVYPHAVTRPIKASDNWMVDYSKLTPVIVASIQDLDIKLKDIEDLTNENENSFVVKLRNWFASSSNGIKSLFVKDMVCIGETCINEEQLKALILYNQGNTVIENNNQEENTPTPEDLPAQSGESEESIDENPAAEEVEDVIIEELEDLPAEAGGVTTESEPIVPADDGVEPEIIN